VGSIEPAYRTRTPDDRAYREAVEILARIERRRRLAAEHRRGPGSDRPRWYGLALDFAAVPALWAAVVVMLVNGHWWIVPAAIIEAATIYAYLRRSSPR
jgi:hypothetical protein